MEQRMRIITAIFDKEVQALEFKAYPMKSAKYEKHQKLLELLRAEFFPKAKHAVLTKYLNICKTMHLNEIMMWRRTLIHCQLTPRE